jgi:hypothetical protein
MNSYTPYAAANIVNAALVEAGVDKKVPPQMMYNYTSARINKGKLPLIPATQDENGKVMIPEEGLVEWTAKYVRKQIALATIEE